MLENTKRAQSTCSLTMDVIDARNMQNHTNASPVYVVFPDLDAVEGFKGFVIA